MGTSTISLDEFQALEAKVLQAVELIRKEREARSAAEAERDELRTRLAQAEAEREDLRSQLSNASGSAQAEAEALQREREAVKARVEKMLSQMDELL